MLTDVPKVKTRAVLNQDGRWDLYIICPYCGKEHHHGGGDGKKPNLGYRSSHCTGTRMGLLEYELVDYKSGRRLTIIELEEANGF